MIFRKRYIAVLLGILIPVSVAASPELDQSQNLNQGAQSRTGVVVMDVFVRSDRDSAARATSYAQALQKRTRGLEVRVHDVLTDKNQLRRLYSLSKRMGRDKPSLPAFHTCDRMFFGFTDGNQTGPSIEQLFTANLYTRSTCPRCQKLKAFVPSVQRQWPAIRFVNHDVDASHAAMQKWKLLCQRAGRAPGLPTIEFARRILVGYQSDAITGAELQALIRTVAGNSMVVERPDQSRFRNDESASRVAKAIFSSMPPLMLAPVIPVAVAGVTHWDQVEQAETFLIDDSADRESSADDLSDLLDLPEEASPEEMGETLILVEEEPAETIQVPFFGELNASELGMPVFTLAVGLVDGFNPCAMWVLVFLLSVLVNIKDRRKILMIAGTFVIVSGLAYFAFMAAWLNVFMLVGMARPVQVALACLAILIGVINVKDFFAFKQGISLSIPESQKPGLYRRVRKIVSAKYLSVALGSAIVLAVIVNMIELLCTAGLPALYTQVLTMQEYPVWKNYAYLGLYIGAYMFDDAVLVGIVVVTLSHRKLQEREGRWLKLLSGLVILALGLVMLFHPEWLQPGS